MAAVEQNKKPTRTKRKLSTIDALYNKFTHSVRRAIGSTEFYEFFMDTMSRADSEIQFSNRKMEKIIDIKWVDAIEKAIPAMQNIVANPRNIIREEELIVNVANAKKGGSDVVRHLAQHGQLVDNFDEETGEVRPNKLMQKYREDSDDLYENRLAFTVIETSYHFVKIRYDALAESMGDEYGAKLKVETDYETSIELMHFDMFMHIKQKDSALEVDEKVGNVFARIERLNRLLASFMNSPWGEQMAKLNRVRGKIVKTNVLKKNPNYKKIADLYDFLRMYDDVGYAIKIVEQNPRLDEEFVENIFHNILFQYIILKGHLEDEEDRQVPTPLKQRKRKLRPKVIKEIIEELTEDYDVPDLEIRKVLIEELTKEQLMLEEAEERRRLVEEAEKRRLEEEERQRQIEAEVQERLRQEKEAEAERLRLEKEEEERKAKVAALEEKLEDERRKNIFMQELEYFANHLYDRLDERSQLEESMKDIEGIEDFENAAKELEDKENAERLALELEEARKLAEEHEAILRQKAEEERIRVQQEAEQLAHDNELIAPYLDEVRNFQVMLASRRQMRLEESGVVLPTQPQQPKVESKQTEQQPIEVKEVKSEKKDRRSRFFD